MNELQIEIEAEKGFRVLESRLRNVILTKLNTCYREFSSIPEPVYSEQMRTFMLSNEYKKEIARVRLELITELANNG